MPLFPGERPMTPIEALGNSYDTENAFAHFEAQTGLRRTPASFRNTLITLPQTGLPRDLAHISVVPVEGAGDFLGYIVARPFRTVRGPRGIQLPDADRWWVFDSDVDETEGWIPQATFTRDGLIDYGGPNGDGEGGDGGGEEDLDLPSPSPPSGPPRDPTAPVRMNIDLDEAERDEAEGLPAWEVHDDFSVLTNANGFAVVHNAHGIVRYPDKTACTFMEGSASEAQRTAEKFLANRPYRTAMERVMGEADFDAPEPSFTPEPPTAPAVPRPQAQKRVWDTVPITSADEDD